MVTEMSQGYLPAITQNYTEVCSKCFKVQLHLNCNSTLGLAKKKKEVTLRNETAKKLGQLWASLSWITLSYHGAQSERQASAVKIHHPSPPRLPSDHQSRVGDKTRVDQEE